MISPQKKGLNHLAIKLYSKCQIVGRSSLSVAVAPCFTKTFFMLKLNLVKVQSIKRLHFVVTQTRWRRIQLFHVSLSTRSVRQYFITNYVE